MRHETPDEGARTPARQERWLLHEVVVHEVVVHEVVHEVVPGDAVLAHAAGSAVERRRPFVRDGREPEWGDRRAGTVTLRTHSRNI